MGTSRLPFLEDQESKFRTSQEPAPLKVRLTSPQRCEDLGCSGNLTLLHLMETPAPGQSSPAEPPPLAQRLLCWERNLVQVSIK